MCSSFYIGPCVMVLILNNVWVQVSIQFRFQNDALSFHMFWEISIPSVTKSTQKAFSFAWSVRVIMILPMQFSCSIYYTLHKFSWFGKGANSHCTLSIICVFLSQLINILFPFHPEWKMSHRPTYLWFLIFVCPHDPITHVPISIICGRLDIWA